MRNAERESRHIFKSNNNSCGLGKKLLSSLMFGWSDSIKIALKSLRNNLPYIAHQSHQIRRLCYIITYFIVPPHAIQRDIFVSHGVI